jgi:ribosomal protein L7/L12
MTAHDFWEFMGLCFVAGVISSFWPSRGKNNEKRLTRLEQQADRLERKVDLILEHLGIDASAATPIRPGAIAGDPARTGADGAFGLPPGVSDLLLQGRKINAIKLYREATGVGLKDAKDAVERVEAYLKRVGRI